MAYNDGQRKGPPPREFYEWDPRDGKDGRRREENWRSGREDRNPEDRHDPRQPGGGYRRPGEYRGNEGGRGGGRGLDLRDSLNAGRPFGRGGDLRHMAPLSDFHKNRGGDLRYDEYSERKFRNDDLRRQSDRGFPGGRGGPVRDRMDDDDLRFGRSPDRNPSPRGGSGFYDRDSPRTRDDDPPGYSQARDVDLRQQIREDEGRREGRRPGGEGEERREGGEKKELDNRKDGDRKEDPAPPQKRDDGRPRDMEPEEQRYYPQNDPNYGYYRWHHPHLHPFYKPLIPFPFAFYPPPHPHQHQHHHHHQIPHPEGVKSPSNLPKSPPVLQAAPPPVPTSSSTPTHPSSSSSFSTPSTAPSAIPSATPSASSLQPTQPPVQQQQAPIKGESQQQENVENTSQNLAQNLPRNSSQNSAINSDLKVPQENEAQQMSVDLPQANSLKSEPEKSSEEIQQDSQQKKNDPEKPSESDPQKNLSSKEEMLAIIDQKDTELAQLEHELTSLVKSREKLLNLATSSHHHDLLSSLQLSLAATSSSASNLGMSGNFDFGGNVAEEESDSEDFEKGPIFKIATKFFEENKARAGIAHEKVAKLHHEPTKEESVPMEIEANSVLIPPSDSSAEILKKEEDSPDQTQKEPYEYPLFEKNVQDFHKMKSLIRSSLAQKRRNFISKQKDLQNQYLEKIEIWKNNLKEKGLWDDEDEECCGNLFGDPSKGINPIAQNFPTTDPLAMQSSHLSSSAVRGQLLASYGMVSASPTTSAAIASMTSYSYERELYSRYMSTLCTVPTHVTCTDPVSFPKYKFIDNNRFIPNVKTEEANYRHTSMWSVEEEKQFVKYWSKYHKDFSKISSHIFSKSIKDCIKFYYVNKKRLELKTPEEGVIDALGEMDGIDESQLIELGQSSSEINVGQSQPADHVTPTSAKTRQPLRSQVMGRQQQQQQQNPQQFYYGENYSEYSEGGYDPYNQYHEQQYSSYYNYGDYDQSGYGYDYSQYSGAATSGAASASDSDPATSAPAPPPQPSHHFPTRSNAHYLQQQKETQKVEQTAKQEQKPAQPTQKRGVRFSHRRRLRNGKRLGRIDGEGEGEGEGGGGEEEFEYAELPFDVEDEEEEEEEEDVRRRVRAQLSSGASGDALGGVRRAMENSQKKRPQREQMRVNPTEDEEEILVGAPSAQYTHSRASATNTRSTSRTDSRSQQTQKQSQHTQQVHPRQHQISPIIPISPTKAQKQVRQELQLLPNAQPTQIPKTPSVANSSANPTSAVPNLASEQPKQSMQRQTLQLLPPPPPQKQAHAPPQLLQLLPTPKAPTAPSPAPAPAPPPANPSPVAITPAAPAPVIFTTNNPAQNPNALNSSAKTRLQPLSVSAITSAQSSPFNFFGMAPGWLAQPSSTSLPPSSSNFPGTQRAPVSSVSVPSTNPSQKPTQNMFNNSSEDSRISTQGKFQQQKAPGSTAYGYNPVSVVSAPQYNWVSSPSISSLSASSSASPSPNPSSSYPPSVPSAPSVNPTSVASVDPLVGEKTNMWMDNFYKNAQPQKPSNAQNSTGQTQTQAAPQQSQQQPQSNHLNYTQQQVSQQPQNSLQQSPQETQVAPQNYPSREQTTVMLQQQQQNQQFGHQIQQYSGQPTLHDLAAFAPGYETRHVGQEKPPKISQPEQPEMQNEIPASSEQGYPGTENMQSMVFSKSSIEERQFSQVRVYPQQDPRPVSPVPGYITPSQAAQFQEISQNFSQQTSVQEASQHFNPPSYPPQPAQTELQVYQQSYQHVEHPLKPTPEQQKPVQTRSKSTTDLNQETQKENPDVLQQTQKWLEDMMNMPLAAPAKPKQAPPAQPIPAAVQSPSAVPQQPFQQNQQKFVSPVDTVQQRRGRKPEEDAEAQKEFFETFSGFFKQPTAPVAPKSQYYYDDGSCEGGGSSFNAAPPVTNLPATTKRENQQVPLTSPLSSPSPPPFVARSPSPVPSFINTNNLPQKRKIEQVEPVNEGSGPESSWFSKRQKVEDQSFAVPFQHQHQHQANPHYELSGAPSPKHFSRSPSPSPHFNQFAHPQVQYEEGVSPGIPKPNPRHPSPATFHEHQHQHQHQHQNQHQHQHQFHYQY